MGNVRGNYSDYEGAADKFVPLDKSLPFLDWLSLGHDSSGEAAEKDTLGHHFLPRLPGPPRGGTAQTPAPRRKPGQLCQAQVPSQSRHRHLAQSPSSSRGVRAGAMGCQQARSGASDPMRGCGPDAAGYLKRSSSSSSRLSTLVTRTLRRSLGGSPPPRSSSGACGDDM